MIMNLGGGLRTTVHVAEYDLREFALRVVRLPEAMPLLAWCQANAVPDALVGGFYLRQPQKTTDPLLSGLPLGDLRSDGQRIESVPFEAPWGHRRACVHSVSGEVRIARRDKLPVNPKGELLQAGPLLVEDGETVEIESEGFSEGSGQFDSDITVGRHPRAALGIGRGKLIAVATEGRTSEDAGLTIPELARTMVETGADSAFNLDGGGSTSLVTDGRLVNSPREGHGTLIPGGRPVASAIVFVRT